jgi:predicted O-methyltransferase YrrM
MRLLWREVYVDDVVFDTSVTDSEILALRALANDHRVLEIGTAYGYSACRMAQVAEAVITVDPHDAITLPNSLDIARSNASRLNVYDNLVFIVGHSQSVMPVMTSLNMSFDLVFIDGDHLATVVYNDLLRGWSLLRSGGVLAAHDYGEDTCPDVKHAIDNFNFTEDCEGKVATDTLWIAVKP